jgi:hypothetical protein
MLETRHGRYRWSDLQDFGIQSSQIGPHLVQPFISNPKAITLTIKPARRNMVHHSRVSNYTVPGPTLSSRRAGEWIRDGCVKAGETGVRAKPATRETFRHLPTPVGRVLRATNPVLNQQNFYFGVFAGSAGLVTPQGSYFCLGSGIRSSAAL